MAKDPRRYKENTHTACQKISHPHPGLIKTSQTGVLYGYSVCSVVLAYSWKLLTFLRGKESAQLRNLHYFIFFWIKQPLIKERKLLECSWHCFQMCDFQIYTGQTQKSPGHGAGADAWKFEGYLWFHEDPGFVDHFDVIFPGSLWCMLLYKQG